MRTKPRPASKQHVPKNERDYLLLSVQRSGTRFTQRILTQAGVTTAQIHPVETRRTQLQGWLDKNSKEGLPIIVAMRHPLSVAKSWRARSEPVEKMFEQYQLLIELCELSRPIFLPVDHPERDDFLHFMGKELGLTLETDWAKYGHRPDHPSAQIELETAVHNQVAELCATELISALYTEDVPHGT